jgi:hypothetical protein
VTEQKKKKKAQRTLNAAAARKTLDSWRHLYEVEGLTIDDCAGRMGVGYSAARRILIESGARMRDMKGREKPESAGDKQEHKD